MNIDGLVVAFASFFIIGLFHPIVIKAEYHFGTRCWPVFCLAGSCSIAVSVFVTSTFLSSVFGVLGCTCFWSILELFHQKKRVEKGWFPKNPNRKY
ncbi:MAG: DUF4491 family protein [Proteobacteria bacterium]|nr:DUF4491 family protein [Pseudomonadota bacterium]